MWKRVAVAAAAAVSVGLTGFAPAPMPDPGRQAKCEQEKARLQGNWTVEEYNHGSGPSSPYGTPARVQISGDRWAQTARSGVVVNQLGGLDGTYLGSTTSVAQAFRLVVEPGGKGGAVDLVNEAGKRTVHKGIYKVEGDVLTVCYRQADGAARPTSFEDRDGQVILLKLRRVR